MAPELPANEDWAQGRLELPGGLLDSEGACHKTVRIRELTGADEERLCDRSYRNRAEQVTDFLVHLIDGVEGHGREIDADTVSGMLIGDRDYLILRARQISLGDSVHQVLTCSKVACGEKVDVEFAISELPVHRVPEVRRDYEFELSRPALADDEDSRQGTLRLATGGDQAEIADLIEVNAAKANTRLFSRVILTLGRRRGLDLETARGLPLQVRRELAAELRRRSPGPDLRVEINCPHCGADLSYVFALNDFFFEEWTMNLNRLYSEVHQLAFHYHWAEPSILALSRTKRRRYLSLVARQLEAAG